LHIKAWCILRVHFAKRVLHLRLRLRAVDGNLMHARPHQKHTKTHQLVRNSATPPSTSKTWCILRVHLEKRVLHLRAVDAGAATPENTKKTPTCQKFCNTTWHIKSMVHPEGALCKRGAALTYC
jgi:hypothetical protein